MTSREEHKAEIARLLELSEQWDRRAKAAEDAGNLQDMLSCRATRDRHWAQMGQTSASYHSQP